MIELYAAVLYNFSVIGTTVDATTMPDSFVSEFSPQHKVFITENEDGTFEEQEQALADGLQSYGPAVFMRRLAGAAVSIYALFKIVQAVFFS
jgi:hypothetical protein